MTTALVSKQFIAGFGDAFKAAAGGKPVDFVTLPEAPGALQDTRGPDKPVNDIGPRTRVSTHSG